MVGDCYRPWRNYGSLVNHQNIQHPGVATEANMITWNEDPSELVCTLDIAPRRSCKLTPAYRNRKARPAVMAISLPWQWTDDCATTA
jgi:hypothetical protein